MQIMPPVLILPETLLELTAEKLVRNIFSYYMWKLLFNTVSWNFESVFVAFKL